jgi:hypothetical protein
LRKAGINTEKKARRHWITSGQKEGRILEKLTDIINYIITTDITAANITTTDITAANITTNTNLNKNLLIIASHTNNDIKYSILKNNIKYFDKEYIDIVLINSIECENLYNYSISEKIIDKIFIMNNVLIDFGKWIYVIENKDYIKNYNNINFTNDSYIIVNNIDAYLNNINNNNYDLYGYNDSS